MDVIDRVPKLGRFAAHTRQAMQDKRVEHKSYIAKYGDDQPVFEIGNGTLHDNTLGGHSGG